MLGTGFEYNGGMYVPGQYSEDVVERSLQRASEERGSGDVLSDFLMPRYKEERQLGQQLAMDYAEPQFRMKGLIAAGINPLTAAAGVAGASPSSVSSPAASSNPVGDIASAAGSIAGGVDSLGSAAKAFAEAAQVKPLADSTIDKNRAEIDKWSHENGFTDAQTQAFNIDNQTRDNLNRAELNVKRQQFRNMRVDAEYVRKQRDYVAKQIQWYDEQIQAEIDLDKKRSLEAEKHAFEMEENTRTAKMENDFAEKYKYRRDMPFDAAMLSCWFEGEFDKVQKAQDFMYNLKYGLSYNESLGNFDAEVDTAFAKSFNESLGVNEVNAEFAPFYAKLEANKDALVALVKETLSNPTNVRGIVTKLITLLSSMGLSAEILNGPVNNASKPYPSSN